MVQAPVGNLSGLCRRAAGLDEDFFDDRRVRRRVVIGGAEHVYFRDQVIPDQAAQL
jgi:hypothetical protein